MNVLLVDDDPVIRLAAAHALRAAGHTVVEAADGAAARAAASRSVDVVILDVLLGDEDGVAVAGELRTHDTLRTVPILFLTGRADHERERLLAAGAVGVLAKPFDLTTFAADVQRVLST